MYTTKVDLVRLVNTLPSCGSGDGTAGDDDESGESGDETAGDDDESGESGNETASDDDESDREWTNSGFRVSVSRRRVR